MSVKHQYELVSFDGKKGKRHCYGLTMQVSSAPVYTGASPMSAASKALSRHTRAKRKGGKPNMAKHTIVIKKLDVGRNYGTQYHYTGRRKRIPEDERSSREVYIKDKKTGKKKKHTITFDTKNVLKQTKVVPMDMETKKQELASSRIIDKSTLRAKTVDELKAMAKRRGLDVKEPNKENLIKALLKHSAKKSAKKSAKRSAKKSTKRSAKKSHKKSGKASTKRRRSAKKSTKRSAKKSAKKSRR